MQFFMQVKTMKQKVSRLLERDGGCSTSNVQLIRRRLVADLQQNQTAGEDVLFVIPPANYLGRKADVSTFGNKSFSKGSGLVSLITFYCFSADGDSAHRTSIVCRVLIDSNPQKRFFSVRWGLSQSPFFLLFRSILSQVELKGPAAADHQSTRHPVSSTGSSRLHSASHWRARREISLSLLSAPGTKTHHWTSPSAPPFTPAPRGGASPPAEAKWSMVRWQSKSGPCRSSNTSVRA